MSELPLSARWGCDSWNIPQATLSGAVESELPWSARWDCDSVTPIVQLPASLNAVGTSLVSTVGLRFELHTLSGLLQAFEQSELTWSVRWEFDGNSYCVNLSLSARREVGASLDNTAGLRLEIRHLHHATRFFVGTSLDSAVGLRLPPQLEELGVDLLLSRYFPGQHGGIATSCRPRHPAD